MMKKLISAALIALIVTAGIIHLTGGFGGSEELQLKTFASYDEVKDYLKEKAALSYGYGTVGAAAMRADTSATVETAAGVPSAAPAKSTDYSATNIQVAGVDEADIVKTDGEYIYALSGQKVYIIKAYPADGMEIVSTIELEGYGQEFFINGDRLVVFGNAYTPYHILYGDKVVGDSVKVVSESYPYYSAPQTFIKIYDISDRENPELAREIKADGNYFDSRMIGGWAYAVVNAPVNDIERPVLPAVISDGLRAEVAPSKVHYFDIPDYSYQFTTFLAIDISKDDSGIESKTFLTGSTQNLYVSNSNIYAISQRRLSEIELMDDVLDIIISELPAEVSSRIRQIQGSDLDRTEKYRAISEVMNSYFSEISYEEQERIRKKAEARMIEIARKAEQTIIHRIEISDGKIEYKAGGLVPGTVLNQFSMDEFDGKFRIATTVQAGRSQSENNVYVLDEGMDIIGRLEGLAPGERIFSARFIGDKAYLVTFRRIDPLFVIDLSSPSSPRVAGELKIPGFSDYLHPYDENHIIGIGRDIDPETNRDLGVKIGLFDVSDPASPKEVAKFVAGEGTYSEALQDHKAFLFNKEKSLLVLPMTKYSFWAEPAIGGEILPAPKPFNGAYVFEITEDGIELRGRVEHTADGEGPYYYTPQVRRSLYIEDVLYTISESAIKANSLGDLEGIGSVQLGESLPVPEIAR